MNATQKTNSDERRACLAGTRMLIAEASFDALIELLIASGAVSRHDTSVMAERLSQKLLGYVSGENHSEWCIVPNEIVQAATRFSDMAADMRERS